jgi:hypothetical protein
VLLATLSCLTFASALCHFATMDFSGLALADVHVNPKGAKSCLLTNSGARFHYTTPESTRAPFGPSNFDKDPAATRQNLELRCTTSMAHFFRALDEWAVEYISAHSQRIWKKQLSLAQVRDMYHPTLRTTEGYEPLLRTKLNMPGVRGAVRFWTTDGQLRDAPADWRDADVKAHLHISHLWLMGGSCGLVVNCCDLMVSEGSRAFPFAPPESFA